MSYRGPQTQRIASELTDIFRHAGQTATWRQYISASAGVSVAGFGSSAFYREQTITAVFGQYVLPAIVENQREAGIVVQGVFNVTTREKLARNDELIWNSVTYRIESEPVPARMAGTWLSQVKRGGQ